MALKSKKVTEYILKNLKDANIFLNIAKNINLFPPSKISKHEAIIVNVEKESLRQSFLNEMNAIISDETEIKQPETKSETTTTEWLEKKLQTLTISEKAPPKPSEKAQPQPPPQKTPPKPSEKAQPQPPPQKTPPKPSEKAQPQLPPQKTPPKPSEKAQPQPPSAKTLNIQKFEKFFREMDTSDPPKPVNNLMFNPETMQVVGIITDKNTPGPLTMEKIKSIINAGYVIDENLVRSLTSNSDDGITIMNEVRTFNVTKDEFIKLERMKRANNKLDLTSIKNLGAMIGVTEDKAAYMIDSYVALKDRYRQAYNQL